LSRLVGLVQELIDSLCALGLKLLLAISLSLRLVLGHIRSSIVTHGVLRSSRTKENATHAAWFDLGRILINRGVVANYPNSQCTTVVASSDHTHDRHEQCPSEAAMPSLLVHITCGPENPTKATLACFVAAAAVEAGHEVHVFLAGDAVQLLREPVRTA
jgi:hypothetical protein